MNSSQDSITQSLSLFHNRLQRHRRNKAIDPEEVLNFFRDTYHIAFPPKIRDLIFDIISLKILRAVVKACRGGGKSYAVAIIEYILWKERNFDCANMGGSESQAKIVYDALRNFVYDDPGVKTVRNIQSEIRKDWGITTSGEPRLDGPFIRCFAASQKQARGTHPGNRNRGGLLVLDEECEMDEDIVNAAKPQIDTANPSILIRLSTFHKAYGSFQETWDKAEEIGYKQYEWDCFDIAGQCKDDCETCFPEFNKKYCKGKAKGSEGWLRIAEIKQAWRERSSDEDFEVEYMGWRPSGRGLVVAPDLIARAVRPAVFNPGIGGVGFGFDHGYATEACMVVVQDENNIKKVIDIRFWTNVPIDVKGDEVKEAWDQYRGFAFNGDATGQGKELNTIIRRKGIPVKDIQFGKEKTIGIENLLWHLTRNYLAIDPKFTKAIGQLRNWRRDKKKDDHFCDALICALLSWNMLTSGPPGTSSFKLGKKKRATHKQEW